MAGKAEAASSRAQVFVRLKPPSPDDYHGRCVEADGDRTLRICADAGKASDTPSDVAIALADASDRREFCYDGIFEPKATQSDVFMKVGLPILRSCLLGINGTILAYGQTGSGKTYSLLQSGGSEEQVGMLGWLVATLFVHVAHDVRSSYTIEASALQVYNQQVDDLIHPRYNEGGGHNLTVQNGGAVPSQTWIRCGSADKLLDVFLGARSNLVYAETKLNKAASRSHAIFQMRITRGLQDGSRHSTTSRLSVVDLAGSERVRRSDAANFQETTHINKSLLALGNTMHALAMKQRYVPTRDSKLTRILDGSIGGSCQTSLLVCVSTSIHNTSETLRSLEFASRAMDVEVEPKVNITQSYVWNSRPISPTRNDLRNSRLTSPRSSRPASPEVRRPSTTPSTTEAYGSRNRSSTNSSASHSVDHRAKYAMSEFGRMQQGNSSSSTSLPENENNAKKMMTHLRGRLKELQHSEQSEEDVFEVRFTGSPWPYPANFETELLRALAACWAIKIRDIVPPVIRHLDGVTVAEFRGPPKTIQELSRLPLQYLSDLVPSAKVETVSKPSKSELFEEESWRSGADNMPANSREAHWHGRAMAAELRMKALELRAAEAEARADAMEKAMQQTWSGCSQSSVATSPSATPPQPNIRGSSTNSSLRNKMRQSTSGSRTQSSVDVWMGKQLMERSAEIEQLQKRHAAEVSKLEAELARQKSELLLALESQKPDSPTSLREPSEDGEVSRRVLSVNFKLQSPDTSHAKAFEARAEAGRLSLEERLVNVGRRVNPFEDFAVSKVPRSFSREHLNLDAVSEEHSKESELDISGVCTSEVSH